MAHVKVLQKLRNSSFGRTWHLPVKGRVRSSILSDRAQTHLGGDLSLTEGRAAVDVPPPYFQSGQAL